MLWEQFVKSKLTKFLFASVDFMLKNEYGICTLKINCYIYYILALFIVHFELFKLFLQHEK